MTNDEIAARLNVLEAFVLQSLDAQARAAMAENGPSGAQTVAFRLGAIGSVRRRGLTSEQSKIAGDYTKELVQALQMLLNTNPTKQQ